MNADASVPEQIGNAIRYLLDGDKMEVLEVHRDPSA
jgi:hypothetical protein